MMDKQHRNGITLARLEEAKGVRDLRILETKHSGHLAGTTAGQIPRHGHKLMQQMATQSLKRLQAGMGDAGDDAFLEETATNLRALADSMAAEQKAAR